MDRYTARITAQGNTQRERYINRIKRDVNNKAYQNPSYKDVKINGVETNLVIDNGTSNPYKKFASLPGTIIKLGDYVEWDNRIYLVDNLNKDDEIYSSGTMTLCTYVIAWQKPNGSIVTRWGCMADFNKYNEGTVANGNLTVPTGSIGVTVPIDYETRRLKLDMRFILDITTDVEYAEGVIPEVYKLSSRKTVFNNNEYFNRGGTMTLTMSFDSFDPVKDKYVSYTAPNGTTKSVWVCNYNQTTPPSQSPTYPNLTAAIEGSTECYFADYCYWDVVFTDENGTVLTVDQIPTDWKCVLAYSDGTVIDGIMPTVDGLEIELYVDDDTLLGETLLLEIILDDTVLATKKIEVLGGF